MRPSRATLEVSSAGLISPLQPNHRVGRVLAIDARATATPPACAAWRRSSTRFETTTRRLMLLFRRTAVVPLADLRYCETHEPAMGSNPEQGRVGAAKGHRSHARTPLLPARSSVWCGA